MTAIALTVCAGWAQAQAQAVSRSLDCIADHAPAPCLNDESTLSWTWDGGPSLIAIVNAAGSGHGADMPVEFGAGSDASVDTAFTMTGSGGSSSFSSGLQVRSLADGGSESLVTVATSIPERSTYALMLAGLGVVGFVARRRRAD